MAGLRTAQAAARHRAVTPPDYSRREILDGIGAGLAATGLAGMPWASAARAHGGDGWSSGDVAHLIPTASHDRLLVKASLCRTLASPPTLDCGAKRVIGVRTGSSGRFWRFAIDGLEPGASHDITLRDGDGARLCDPWPLATFPHPEARPERLRLIAYTCGGGDESLIQGDGVALFRPLAERRALLMRALSLQPDALIANGDQIYYDERTMVRKKPPMVIAAWQDLFDRIGLFDRTLPILGTANEDILHRIGDRQIAMLYGTLLRSTPTFMLGDDHDLFENDEADDELVTLPPDPHMLEAARAVQRLYCPEFLPDGNRPEDLPGFTRTGEAESYGTLRYGRLFEGLLYDTKRYVGTGGKDAVMIPPAVEAWLATRTAANDTRHLLHMPSTPIGWSAGKWGEWYPDLLDAEGRLSTAIAKPYWPQGWWTQHQRLLAMLGAQTGRVPAILSGDLHMFSAGQIMRSGDLDFSANPIHTIVSGPLGTGDPAYPSSARGVLPRPPVDMQVTEGLAPVEKLGFTMIDVTEDRMEMSFFAWRPPEPVEAIASLQPFHRLVLNRRS
ncbi:MAG: hypothetical protein R3E02_01785 [Blastomonas sp.]